LVPLAEFIQRIPDRGEAFGFESTLQDLDAVHATSDQNQFSIITLVFNAGQNRYADSSPN
jgi:hypothetical protein